MKYYFDGKKIHSTSRRITKEWIYEKGTCYRNTLGSVYSSKKSAVNAWVKQVKGLVNYPSLKGEACVVIHNE